MNYAKKGECFEFGILRLHQYWIFDVATYLHLFGFWGTIIGFFIDYCIATFQDYCFVILLKSILTVVSCKVPYEIFRYLISWPGIIACRFTNKLVSFLIKRSRQNKKEMLKSVYFEVQGKTCLDKDYHLHVFSWMHYLKP